MNRMLYSTDGIVSLVEYLPEDDVLNYEAWLDAETQSGYNFLFQESFAEYAAGENRQRFFAMILLNETESLIGNVSISPAGTEPDLAIILFPMYRGKGYGTAAFRLATAYALDVLSLSTLHAGCYPWNDASMRMLQKCGYQPNPKGNLSEKHYQTGKNVTQYDFLYVPSSEE